MSWSALDAANITTKNANNSVIKSAYDTSYRSWFACSAGFLFLAMFSVTFLADQRP